MLKKRPNKKFDTIDTKTSKKSSRYNHTQSRKESPSMTPLKKIFFVIILLVAIMSTSYLSHASEVSFSETNNLSSGPGVVSPAAVTLQNSEPPNSKSTEERSSVQLTLPYGKGEKKMSLEYVHCGPKYSNRSSNSKEKEPIEFVLLHGAKFTKENWVDSGILEEFCIKGSVSAVAIDLSVQSDGDGFQDAIRALVDGGVLSGKPVTVISPSASGKAIVSLGSKAIHNDKILRGLIKFWIPVASPAVLSIKDENVLKSFSAAGVQILAINGDKDNMGKKVTKRLETSSKAEGSELSGGHPVYLDSPHEFVDVVLNFVSGRLSQS